MLQINDVKGKPIQVGSRVWYQRSNGDDVLADVTHIDWQSDICDLAYLVDNGQKACRRTASARMFLQRPTFFARDEEVTAEMRSLQETDPTKWSVTLKQWNRVINECKQNSRYNHIKTCKKPWENYVNMHDMNEHFVIPWSARSGCGLALLLNKQGLDARLMCSHAWSENVDECQEAVNTTAKDQNLCAGLSMWFCTFAQYQPQDECGPSIKEQLDLEPFTKVIKSAGVGKMIAIHTTAADLYSRLWCVLEMDEALSLSSDIEVVPAFSEEYLENAKEEYLMSFNTGSSHQQAAFSALGVNTSQARCSPLDKLRLKEAISKHGGFQRIDEAVAKFRQSKFGCVARLALEAALTASDSESELRCSAAAALADLGEHAAPAVPALIALLQDQDEKLRLCAAEALGKLGQNLSSQENVFSKIA